MLAEILRRQAEYLAMMDEMRRKVISALIYPSIVFSAALVLIGIFLVFLVPQLSSLLSRTGQSLPRPTFEGHPRSRNAVRRAGPPRYCGPRPGLSSESGIPSGP